jgi:hypothetical protein
MPDAMTDAHDGPIQTSWLPLNRDRLAQCLGIAGENPSPHRNQQSKNAKSASYCEASPRSVPASVFRPCRF